MRHKLVFIFARLCASDPGAENTKLLSILTWQVTWLALGLLGAMEWQKGVVRVSSLLRRTFGR